MKIERISRSHLRYTLNDGTVREHMGGPANLDEMERDLRDAMGSSPVGNAAPQTEEIYQMPVMNFGEVSHVGFGGGLMEGSAQAPPPKPQSYAGAGGAPPGQASPQGNDETPYTMPSLFPEWDQRLQSVTSKPTGNTAPMFHANAFITEEVYQMPSVMSVACGAVQNKGDLRSPLSVGREEDSVPYTMPSVF